VPDVTTNRVGATDANGNSSAYGWDAENRLVASANPPAASYTRYAYDGQNKQIWSCTWNTASGLCTTDNGYSFYSPAGKLLGTFTIAFQPYYYVKGSDGYQLIPDSLTITNGTPLAYFGSRRLWVTDRVGSQGRFFPYGEDRTGMNYPQNGQYAFGTYLDNGSGLYYADQRWYAAAPGRFLSPDPYNSRSGRAGRVASPATWNLYSYVGGDPINRIDPTGSDIVCVGPSDDFDCFDVADDAKGGGGVDGNDDPGGLDKTKNQKAASVRQIVLTITNAHISGPQQTRIMYDIDWLGSHIDANCKKWLETGQVSSFSAFLSQISTTIGWGTITSSDPNAVVNAVTGAAGANGDGSAAQLALSIVINANGAFFNTNVKSGGYQGTQAQINILLHEFAHANVVPGFHNDASSQKLGDSNNDMVKQNCGNTIDAVLQ
jgi:RHS repeat-associated protein